MEDLLKDIPGVFCYLDDVLITTGTTDDEHDERLRLVLAAFQSAGLRLSIEKCNLLLVFLVCLI